MEQFKPKYEHLEAVKFTGTDINIQEIKNLLGDRFIEYDDQGNEDTLIEFWKDKDNGYTLFLWLNNYLLPFDNKFLVITEDVFEELFIKTN